MSGEWNRQPAGWDRSGSRDVSRRSFLASAAVAPLAAVVAGERGEHRLRYDHVLGTSLDLSVRARSRSAAARAERTVLEVIERLAAVLSTRDAGSEISAFAATGRVGSRQLQEMLELYDEWERRCGVLSIRPRGAGTPLNVDALGKAFILERAADAAHALPGIDGLTLNIGGDIVVRGGEREVEIADPSDPFDNAPALTCASVRNAAIATSGVYARGRHLWDPRSGRSSAALLGATVVAGDAVTANALATAACLLGPDDGMALVHETPGAAALLVGPEGREYRSRELRRIERPRRRPVAAAAEWANGFQVTMTLTLAPLRGRGAAHRPYVGVWAEDLSNKLVRVLAFWANEPKYFGELSILYNRAGRRPDRLLALARATRAPGRYDLVWDGLDDQRAPVPAGSYRIVVETNQEGGSYAKQSGVIVCGDVPAEVMLPGSVNAEPVAVSYGPKARTA